MDAYLYIPANETDEAINCGIKLSAKGEKKIPINGYPTMCISALLNPKDDMVKYNSDDFSCLRIELKPENFYIADKSLYDVESLQEHYAKSIVPPNEYIFGSYRYPECLIPRTILPENLTLSKKGIGFPLLYENSEELYRKNLIETLRDSVECFDDLILKLYFDKIIGEDKCVPSPSTGTNLYFDDSGKYYNVNNVNGDGSERQPKTIVTQNRPH